MDGDDDTNDGVDSSIDGGDEATINIQCANGSKFVVHVNLNSTVEFFKSILAKNCEIQAHQQRLIYKGRILKDDQTLRSYGLEADHTVHLVRGFAMSAPAVSTATSNAVVRSTSSISTTDSGSNEGGPLGGSGFGSSSFPGLSLNGSGSGSGLFGVALPDMEQMQRHLIQNPNMIRDILNMPLAQNLINNPETMRNLIMNNPQMREIMDRNPEIAHVLNDPATIRETLEAARNPEIMRVMMRNTDRAMSNIESSPEGFNMLRRMYENVQEPFLNAATMTGDSGSDLGSNPFVSLLGAQGGGHGRESTTNLTSPRPGTTTNSTAPNTTPLPNPWASAVTIGIQTNSGARSNFIGDVRAISPGGLGGHVLPRYSNLLESVQGSMPDLTSFNQSMQNQTISEIMRSLLSSPQYMNQILGHYPQLQNMFDSYPELRDIMQNPEFIRQLTSPEMIQLLLNLDQVLSQLGSLTSREPGQDTAGTAGTGGNMGLDMLTNMFAGLGTGAGITAPNRSQVRPEELYATQLSQLGEMGFLDIQENIRALIATGGNVHAAVERLLGSFGR